jgi:hypothetical protein
MTIVALNLAYALATIAVFHYRAGWLGRLTRRLSRRGSRSTNRT